MNFSSALKQVKKGKRIARRGWNGKGMFVFLTQPIETKINNEVSNGLKEIGCNFLPCLAIKTADNNICFGWLASQTDMLANDWGVLETRKVKK